MKRGILMVVFGDEYVKIAKACIAETKKHTDLPIYVITNKTVPLGDLRVLIPAPDEDNRQYKTSMINYTPFDQTLYLDCDSVVQKSDLSPVFNLLNDNDVAFNRLLHWKRGDRILNIYKRAMNMAEVKPPIDVYNGGMVGFNKTCNARKMFNKWSILWDKFGRGREMPPLACTVRGMSELKVGVTPLGFYEPESLSDKATIQHSSGQGFIDKFHLPSWTSWKPFDKDPNDFKLVNWKD